MKKAFPIVLLLLLIPLAVFAGGDKKSASELSGSIKIAGSSTVYPVSVAVAEEFNKLHPNVEIPIQSTGTGGGFSNFFIPGKTDANDASRPIKSSEVDRAKANGFDILELCVSTDAVTIVVNPEADWLDDITVEELAVIWRPSAERSQKRLHLLADFITDSAHLGKFLLTGPCGLRGIVEGPVQAPASAREDGTALRGILAAHGDHEIVTSAFPEELIDTVGTPAGQIDTLFLHHLHN
jgi:hypothetical protein